MAPEGANKKKNERRNSIHDTGNSFSRTADKDFPSR